MNILDKEEFRVKLGQINKLVETQDYKGAMQIVDSIDWLGWLCYLPDKQELLSICPRIKIVCASHLQ